VNAEAMNTTHSPLARLTEAELPVALDFRYRMMEECGMVSAVTSNQPLRVEIEPATLNCLTRTSFPTNSMPNG